VANALAGTQHDWSQVFAKYCAVADNSGCCAWRELMATYPLLTHYPRGVDKKRRRTPSEDSQTQGLAPLKLYVLSGTPQK